MTFHRLFIAEKSELAKAIVAGLGGGTYKGGPKSGYYECGGDAVVACSGHMLRLLLPEEYDPAYKKWSFDQLPMSFIPWRKCPIDDRTAQLDLIVSLIAKSEIVVNAGDPDPEGQLLIDEVTGYADYKGPVLRLLINDNNIQIVQRALGRMEDNRKYAGLSAAAEARSVGDQFYGFNLSRAYTLAAKAIGYDGVLSVGRVQTPVLGLVVRRCRENAGHSKAYFYSVTGTFRVGAHEFGATYQLTETDPKDEDGRLNDLTFAQMVATAVSGASVAILSVQTSKKSVSPPLPYNLLKLQADAARKWNYKPDDVLSVTQDLRDKYKLITYNRTDCQYLNDEHHADAPAVLAAVATTAPLLADVCRRANPALKSRAFNNSKTSAHHGIIPTQATSDLSALTERERNIYLLIARSYIAQFWPAYTCDQTTVIVDVAGRSFACRSNVATAQGWKALYRADRDNEEVQDEDGLLNLDLRDLKVGQVGACLSATANTHETKPPPLYTVATLLTELTRVARHVRDERLRGILIEKDKGKEGEHGGIGTPATRHEILKTLFERGFVVEQGKAIIATNAGQEFYDALPDAARFPDLTAIWHEQQIDIEHGRLSVNDFIAGLMVSVTEEVTRVRSAGLKMNVTCHDCPKCGKPLRKRQGQKGPFWGCTGYPECTGSFPDKGGKPDLAPQTSPYKCPTCKKPLVKRNPAAGKGNGKSFWGCTGYPECTATLPDQKGKPAYHVKPTAKKGKDHA